MSDLQALIREVAQSLDEAAPTVTAVEVMAAPAGSDELGSGHPKPTAARSRRVVLTGSAAAAIVAMLIGVVVWRHSTDGDPVVLETPPTPTSELVVVRSDGRIVEIGTDGREVRTVSRLPGSGGGSPVEDPRSPVVTPDGQILVTVSAGGCGWELRAASGVGPSASPIPGHGATVTSAGDIAYAGTSHTAADECSRIVRVRPAPATARRWNDLLKVRYEEVLGSAAASTDSGQALWAIEKERLVKRATELQDRNDPSLSFAVGADLVRVDGVLGSSADGQRLLVAATEACRGPYSACVVPGPSGSEPRTCTGACTPPVLLLAGPVDPGADALPARTMMIAGYDQPGATFVGSADDLVVWEGRPSGSRTVTRVPARAVADSLPLPANTYGPATIVRSGSTALFDVPEAAGAIRSVRPDHDGRALVVVAEHDSFVWDGSALRSLGPGIVGAAWARRSAGSTGSETTAPGTPRSLSPTGTARPAPGSVPIVEPGRDSVGERGTAPQASPPDPHDLVQVEVTVLHARPLADGDEVNLWFFAAERNADSPGSSAVASQWQLLYQTLRVDSPRPAASTGNGTLRTTISVTIPPEAALWIRSGAEPPGLLAVTPSDADDPKACRRDGGRGTCEGAPEFAPDRNG